MNDINSITHGENLVTQPNEKLDELDDYTRELKALAEIALEDNLQLSVFWLCRRALLIGDST